MILLIQGDRIRSREALGQELGLITILSLDNIITAQISVSFLMRLILGKSKYDEKNRYYDMWAR